MISLLEASKKIGKGKTTLLKAINSGRLTASKNEAGEWQLDPAEVFRVYPPVSGFSADLSVVDTLVSGELETAKREIELLRQQISTLEVDKADLRGERDRLLGVVESQTRLITHITGQSSATERAEKPSLLRRLFGSR